MLRQAQHERKRETVRPEFIEGYFMFLFTAASTLVIIITLIISFHLKKNQ